MADQKISELTALTGANVADDDAIAIVDTSATETKKIVFSELKNALDTATGFVRITGDTMTGDLSMGDNVKAIFGSGSDLQIYHDGSNSYIDETGTGTLRIRGYNQVRITDTSDNIAAIFKGDAETTLYHNDSPKLATTSTGISVTGNATFADNGKAIFGAGSDLQIYHDGSASYIDDAGTGNLKIRASNLALKTSSGDDYFTGSDGGEVNLFYNNAPKLATESGGVNITGTLTSDGLTVADSAPTIVVQDSDGTNQIGTLRQGGQSTILSARNDTADGIIKFMGNGSGSETERMRIGSNGDISFYEDTGTTAKFFWDAAAESLGIGTTTFPSNKTKLAIQGDSGASGSGTNVAADEFFIDNDGNTGMTLGSSNTGRGYYAFADSDVSLRAGIFYDHSTDDMGFRVASDTSMTLDASGNLLVGKTVTGVATAGHALMSTGQQRATVSGDITAIHNRLTSDGDIVQFRKDGSTVGSIGVDDNASDTNKTIYICSGNSASSLDVGFKFDWSANQITPCQSGGVDRDDAVDLGSLTVRFDDIYATNGTIQTSDQNEKQDIAELSDAEQRVAVAAKGLLRKFRWRDAVAEKGDEARIHFGIIAQDLQAAFAAEGLDAGDYAMFISSTWTDEETGEERTRMGVRYSELLAFIIAAI